MRLADAVLAAVVCIALSFAAPSCGGGSTTAPGPGDSLDAAADDGDATETGQVGPEKPAPESEAELVEAGDPSDAHAAAESVEDGSSADAGDSHPDSVSDATVLDTPENAEPAPDAGGDIATHEIHELPQGCVVGDFTAYRGNIHAHSTTSDGAGSPADAFAYARDVGKIDFQYITDHLEQLYVIPCLFPNDGWSSCNAMADAADAPGSFVAGCGFEYGTSVGGVTGHNNVYFSDSLFPCLQIIFNEFYQSLVDCPDCIGQFNHPGDMATQTWSNFQYFADVDAKMNLFEFNSDPAWDLYFQALDAGWHVSPLYDQDNHGADWGTKNEGRAGFYMNALSRDGLHDAMRARRSFAATDKNAAIVLKSDDGCWMGSILAGTPTLGVNAEVSDPDPEDGFIALELWGPGAAMIWSTDCGGQGSCTASVAVDVKDATYVFARALQVDGQYLVSAPIWAAP